MKKESNAKALIAAGLLTGAGALTYSKYRKERQKRQADLQVPLSKVDSSMIHRLGYEANKREMHAKFNTGKRYKYRNVSPRTYARLKSAESIGTHFNEHIKDKYRFEKLSAMDKEAVRNWKSFMKLKPNPIKK